MHNPFSCAFVPQVVELELEMSDAMCDIYEALTELLDSCIQELRRSNKIDSTQLTLESGLFRSFDEIVRQQLDSVWHTVSAKTKQVGPDVALLCPPGGGGGGGGGEDLRRTSHLPL